MMMRRIGWLAMVLVVFALVGGCQTIEKSGDEGSCCGQPTCEKAAADKAKCAKACDPAKCDPAKCRKTCDKAKCAKKCKK